MDKLKTIIVDDEPLARRGLKLRLKEFGEIELVDECENGRSAIQAIVNHSPDLVFLDIQMPGIDGFDVIKRIQADSLPLIIFITAFDQYALDAFNVHAVDYLLKPIEDERLQQAISRAKERKFQQAALSEKAKLLTLITELKAKESTCSTLTPEPDKDSGYPEKISIKDSNEVALVKTHDIEWIDAAGDYMCIHSKGETHIMRTTMKQLETLLTPEKFQRVHRSTIVNLDRVVKVMTHMNGEFYLILDNGEKLKMSRSFKEKIKHFI